MKLEYKGKKAKSTKIDDLVNLLEKVNDTQLWLHMGFKVEIDPTVDYNNENILIRWIDIFEGFNDKIIVHSLGEFSHNFKPSN
jgi:hypothetical protein